MSATTTLMEALTITRDEEQNSSMVRFYLTAFTLRKLCKSKLQ
jgi:hypothetical protein